ncbi:MAG TPA: hypothetical protein VG269_20910 [Tepidisphaeraceae bacterium]|nr:hypothetical protein [Tepidisphaeraceae bacterium]
MDPSATPTPGSVNSVNQPTVFAAGKILKRVLPETIGLDGVVVGRVAVHADEKVTLCRHESFSKEKTGSSDLSIVDNPTLAGWILEACLWRPKALSPQCWRVTIDWPGEAESGSAGKQPDKE